MIDGADRLGQLMNRVLLLLPFGKPQLTSNAFIGDVATAARALFVVRRALMAKAKAKNSRAKNDSCSRVKSQLSHGMVLLVVSSINPPAGLGYFPLPLPHWEHRGLTHRHLGAHATRAKTRPPWLGGLDMQHIKGGRPTPGAAHTE